MEKWMNEENEWDHRILATVKEGPADCIRIDEVAAGLKKMKRQKAPDLSGLVAEMIQTTGDIGTQWILDSCNGIVKEGSIPVNMNKTRDYFDATASNWNTSAHSRPRRVTLYKDQQSNRRVGVF